MLCILTIIFYFQPAVHLNFYILTIERSTSFSLATLFESGDGSFRLDLADTDFSTLIPDSDVVGEIGLRLGVSVAAYGLVLLIILAVLFFTAVGKLRKCRIFLIIPALGLYITAGRVILTVPPLANRVLHDAIDRMLGFFARFIHIPDIISIELGLGYWLTLITLGVMLVTEGIFLKGRSKNERTLV
jgi:hypothetical protein